MAILWAKSVFCGVVGLCCLSAFPRALIAQANKTADAEFTEAERLFWLDNWVKARNLYANCEHRLARVDRGKALICRFSRLRADAETSLSYYNASRLIAIDLESEAARAHPEARLRGL